MTTKHAFKCLINKYFCQLQGFDGKTSKEKQKKKRDYLVNISHYWPEKKHVVSHEQCVWEHSISALLQASNLLPSCFPPSLHHSVQLFSLDFPLLCIPSIFAVHSVWNDAMHSSVKSAQISSCPGWFTYGKFGILATANKSRIWLAIAPDHHN